MWLTILIVGSVVGLGAGWLIEALQHERTQRRLSALRTTIGEALARHNAACCESVATARKLDLANGTVALQMDQLAALQSALDDATELAHAAEEACRLERERADEAEARLSALRAVRASACKPRKRRAGK